MTTEEAMEIVYELARQNQLKKGKDRPYLDEECNRQQTALDIVHDFIVNNMEEE